MQCMVNEVAQQEDKNGVIEAIKNPLPQPLPEEGGVGGEASLSLLYTYCLIAFPCSLTFTKRRKQV